MSATKYAYSALSAAAFLAACSGSSSGPSSAGRSVAFQLATKPAGAAIRGAALSGQETIAAGSDTIVVTGVQLVLRRIELERSVPSAVCDSLAASSDDCEEMKAGPVLLDLPLGAGALRSFNVAIDTGSYSKIKFEIHRPHGGNDATFIAANPGFDGVSVKMTGTYNGVAFTYTSDLEVEQEHSFVPPITVTDSTGANLTLFVDLNGWFLNQSATGLIDPATALTGQPNEGEVKSNVEASLNAFEDDNHDGHDDHSSS
ncbi:MAG: hypothetical protein ABI742_01285 [Gemmatimonadota bacterium]